MKAPEIVSKREYNNYYSSMIKNENMRKSRARMSRDIKKKRPITLDDSDEELCDKRVPVTGDAWYQ